MSKEVVRLILELKDELKAGMALLKDSLEQNFDLDERSLRTEIDEIKKSMDLMSKCLDDANGRLKSTNRENKALKKENEELRSRVHALETDLTTSQDELLKSEQYTRNKNVEIKGIPQEPAENLSDILKKLGEAVGEALSPGDVDVCHRVRTKDDTKTNIIVQFQSREKRDQFLEKARKMRLKNDLLGSECDDPIYINEHLCPAMKRLLGMAGARKREHAWKFVWVKNGVIFARRTEKSQIIRINRESDLDKICPVHTT